MVIDIPEVISKEDVEKKLGRIGVKGLDRDKVKELGIFQRLSHLICAMHSLTMVSYRIYGQVENLFGDIGVMKHELKKACQDYEKAYIKWEHFWSDYQTDEGMREMSEDGEDLFNQFMRWASLPTTWTYGAPQRTEPDTDPLIEIDLKDRMVRLYRDVAEKDTKDIEEQWAVMCADNDDGIKKLCCVENGMDKASAQMCAKRMSAEDPDKIYTMSLIQDIEETRTEVIPYKAYLKGEMIGDVKKVRK